MAHKVILSGYYGFNNAGDEAVLAALVQLVRENLPTAEPVALSADPAATAERLGIRAVSRWDKRAVWQEMADAALFCSGGGSLLQDVTSVRSVYFYAAQIKLAAKLGVPTIVLAQGLGPLNTWAGRKLAAGALKKCRILSWRDEKSLKLAQELGVSALPNYQVCDPVLLWHPDVQPAERESADTVVLALRPWRGLDLQKAADLVRGLKADGEKVALLPLYYGGGEACGEDEKLAMELNEILGADAVPICRVTSPEDVWAAIAAAKLVVGMRLHALIMAAAAGVPAVAVSYDPKVSAFAANMGIAELPSGVAFAPDTARTAVREALRRPVNYPLAEEAARWDELWCAVKQIMR